MSFHVLFALWCIVEREADESESHRMLDYFVATGGNFIDTANAYSTTVGSREIEEILKRWLRMQRCEDIIIATKLCGPKGEGRERYFT